VYQLPSLATPLMARSDLTTKERRMMVTLPPPARAGDALLRSSNPELRRLNVKESDETVEITGIVSCYYLKQLAGETLRTAAAGRTIKNRVLVCRDDRPANESFCGM
jgi:hypothetical protein